MLLQNINHYSQTCLKQPPITLKQIVHNRQWWPLYRVNVILHELGKKI